MNQPELKANEAKIKDLEGQRSELQKKIYVVVAQLGGKHLTEDTKMGLSVELALLEMQNTGVVADWVVARQERERLINLSQSQTTLF